MRNRIYGTVTESDLPMANESFPGIEGFYHSLEDSERPNTFLDLLALWNATYDSPEDTIHGRINFKASESIETESIETESIETESNETESNETESNETESNETESDLDDRTDSLWGSVLLTYIQDGLPIDSEFELIAESIGVDAPIMYRALSRQWSETKKTNRLK